MSTLAPAMRKQDYRPDIDGLRAIAVLAVIVFHAFPALLPGGFVGVDIFFVISGFLISKHIWEELQSDHFSIATFYARRVRRIFPALGLVMLLALLLGWILLTPGEYEQLGKHVTAGALFIANLIFWSEAGYFDQAADTKPLLHLWSLGVEEQFYIIWPLFLAFFWRYSHHLARAVVFVLALSFAYSVYVVQHNPVADFYSPLTRFWELALGAFLAHLSARDLALTTQQRDLLSAGGLGLLLVSFVFLNRGMAFPGAWALLPTLGAAALILAAPHSWLNRQLLSHRIMVWLGLISYPLYLWHWPLLSFARISESATPDAEVRASMLLLSIALAWLTYRFWELPLRSRRRSRQLIAGLCLLVFVVGGLGLAVKKLDGIKSRQFSMLNGDAQTIVLGAGRDKLSRHCGLKTEQQALFQYCLSNTEQAPTYALFGDSKAEALFYGLAREAAPSTTLAMIGTVYPPLSSPSTADLQQTKNRLARDTLLALPSVKVVAITVAVRGIFALDAQTGFIRPEAAFPENTLTLYDELISQFERAGKRVMFIIDNPTFPDPTSCISGGATTSAFLNQVLRRKENPYCTVRLNDHLQGTRVYREFIARLRQAHPALQVYDPTPLLCDSAAGVCEVTENGNFLYSYGDHISDYANSKIARDLLPRLDQLAR